ncbi:MAG: 2-hydroxyacyl-CoA dehydratase subunit D [Candidatus Hodarchaeales archaeon]|jgi:benzoyl-CoA reductase subunit C
MPEQIAKSIASYKEPLFPVSESMTIEEIAKKAQIWIEDLSFKNHNAWKIKTDSHIIGTFPVYVPRELIQAFGMQAISLQGGGEFLEITYAESYLGSFICSVPKSTLELAFTGKINSFDGFISPYICDVARNLAGVVERNFPDMSSHMLHYPQNFQSKGSIPFLIAEYKRIIQKFEKITRKTYNPHSLQKQIHISNKKRTLLNELLDFRKNNPGCIRMDEFYLLLRLGGLLPDHEYNTVLIQVIKQIKLSKKRKKDFIPVLIMGPFCEQPTLEIIQLIEDVGFFMVDFDFQIGLRFITEPISEDNDPLEALASAYVKHATQIPTKHNPNGRSHEILTRLQNSGSQAVIFLTAKFCEPALEDFVLYKEAIEKSKNPVPYLQIEFEERSSNFEDVRLQLETLFESILFD